MIRAKIERPAESRVVVLGFVLAALMAAGLMLAAKPAHADDFTVTNTNDSGNGSLRKAIEDANTNKGKDTIEFDIPGGGVKTISPSSELPEITGPVTIDGYSQPGSRPNSRTTGAIDAVILVELRGLDAGSADGLVIEASNVVVRGLAINGFGRGISVESGTGSRIEGNFIGTDASGALDRGNRAFGVSIDGGSKSTIGGLSPEARNLISGNNSNAVELSSNGKGSNKVQGNLMGTHKDGTTPMGGTRVGMFVDAPNNTIGGTEPGAANTIAFNFDSGVEVFGNRNTGNRILGNSIFGNGGLGIDLIGDGRTNDPRDPDAGPNNLQNFPVLTSASSVGDGKITIAGTLDSTPSTRKKKTFTIQFFSNPQGEDEGKTFLGQTTARTDKQGNASFTFETTKPVPDRDEITATATDSRGNTSEFSDPERLFID